MFVTQPQHPSTALRASVSERLYCSGLRRQRSINQGVGNIYNIMYMYKQMPCRNANRGRFPLNGTYFQVNEVFADHEASQNPFDVSRKWSLGCAASATSLII